ncbi:antibiotic biosynthesis monooxygenase [Kitasatospora sp. NBC_00315]|uniref:antibiotic biosynthesis monooxygenase family protein n=1 Tax=Kitasatospora sp. NBC_00315 TaxID=2975963 RepID=UPI003251CD4F
MATFITTFTLKGDTADEFEALFGKYAAFMAEQPGFVDYQMLRSQSDPTTYVNIGRWQDAAAHHAVVSSGEFRTHVGEMMPLVSVKADSFALVSAAEA